MILKLLTWLASFGRIPFSKKKTPVHKTKHIK